MTALLDISGSMAEYCRLILHFLHALGERRRVTTFLFGTRLTNVTRALQRRDPDEALARCSAEVPDWSGGTRIGASLRRFNRDWSRRVLAQGAIVLMFTDGLEREGVEALGAEWSGCTNPAGGSSGSTRCYASTLSSRAPLACAR